MTEEKKLELLAEVFDCEAMSALSLIVMMDDECGKTLTRDQIKGFKTVGDILAWMD